MYICPSSRACKRTRCPHKEVHKFLTNMCDVNECTDSNHRYVKPCIEIKYL